jgi:hypothetical protein
MNPASQHEAPPLLEFEYLAVEDRKQTVATGGYSTKDVAFVKVHRPGSKDVHVEEAEVWGKKLAERARQNLCPSTWVLDFNRLFAAWKNGETLPVEGTPIKAWPVISPSAAKQIIAAGFLTVEQLASANDIECSAIGLQAVEFRNRARQYIEAANGPGKLAEKQRELEAQNAALQAQVNQLIAEVQAQKIAAAVK